MTLRRRLLRIYHYPAYYASWLVFLAVGLALNLACAPFLLARHRARFGGTTRFAIRRLFRAWCAWLHATRLVYVEFRGFTPGALAGPAVYIANHPGLLDATFLLAQLPDTICIFKPALIRNPAIGPAALMAGYASGDHGVDLIRDVAERVADGRSLLVFPEGTRTVAGSDLNEFRPGFAVIAQRAGVPVRPILVRAPRDLLPKRWPWWRAPSFPAHVEIALLDALAISADEPAAALTARAARQFSAALARDDAAVGHPPRPDPEL
ncbi:MAG TPA: lysophospholipid acyltransferase family protein [Opitutus sp.]|nr:lysophospholipid acyltransferase family protein [Opitutus sp.]